MNKKFFAALASATMAFTASGSIAVFADDFVEESNIVDNGDVTPLPATVVWNEANFGALVKKDYATFTGIDTSKLKKDTPVETKDLKGITSITLNAKFNGEVKGLEYFTGLKTFEAKTAGAKVTNKKLDFSANTAVTTLKIEAAKDLTELVFPKADENEEFQLTTLELLNTKMTSLDLSEQEALTNVSVNKNYNLNEVVVRHGTKNHPATYTGLNLNENALETINLDNVAVTNKLDLGKNHFGVLDLSKTTAGSYDLNNQKFYVPEKFGTVNLVETFENLNVEKLTNPAAPQFDKKTGVLTLTGDTTTYTYKVSLSGDATEDMTVQLTKANPMNRLYNPNSGEHFYTADLEEKEALVKLGWNDEGYGWVAPKAEQAGDKAVYRLYNPNAGDHHYTANKVERDTLLTYGWKDENVGWYSDDDTREVHVYRQYNPYANGAGSHNYTTDKAENDYLVSLGWTPEGKAWFALQ